MTITAFLESITSIDSSYGTLKALLKSFKDKKISYIPEIVVGFINQTSKLAVLDDGTDLTL